MTVSIDAIVIKGSGVASKNIKFQMPHLIWHYQAIEHIHTASINVLLDQPVNRLQFDYTTLPTAWWDVDSSRPGRWHEETFSFVEIKFEYPLNSRPKVAWFYIGHDSAYFKDSRRFEIVTEKIAGLVPGVRCRVHIDDRKLAS